MVRFFLGITFGCLVIFLVGLGVVIYLSQPPVDFPTDETITIEPSGLRTLTGNLESAGLIRSPMVFMVFSRLADAERSLQAGSYIFTEPLTAPELIALLQNGENSARIYRLTHTEGRTNAHLASLAEELLANFDRDQFLEIAHSDEGFLFPETYFLAPNTTEEELHKLLVDTFMERVREGRAEQIKQHPLTEYEIITLASIIEREANTLESKKMVSGILQNRLAINMPLQADASIEYVLEKPLSQLTAADLEIDSPYNTYLNRGLPPTPINNPGLLAIDAVLEPATTDYLFYITAPDGTFHYARDFAGHRRNIQRYLR